MTVAPSNPRGAGPRKGALFDGHAATDTGNADRLVAVANGQIRYVHEWLKWVVYLDGAWRRDPADAHVIEVAKGVARELFRHIPDLDGDSRDAAYKWAKRCESRAALSAMVALARGIPGVVTGHELFDADPWALNLINGTLDLRTSTLRAHNPDDLCTLQAPVTYDAAAQAPIFQAVIERALPDPAVRSFLQRFAGSALTGIPVQALVLAVGDGGNSKTVIMETLARVLGHGYYVVPHKSLLVAGRHEQHPTHLATLRGARLLIAPESEAGDRLNEELIKTLTGGDRLRARRMREDEWAFAPSWSAAMHTNHAPRIRGTDEGIWRRLHQVPFDVKIPEPERDDTLIERIAAGELPGVLNWMLKGCADWLERGRRLDPPDAIRQATDTYREQQDHLGRFLAARCIVDPNDPTLSVPARDLRHAYEQWCEEEGEKPWTAKAVGAELDRRGCDSGTVGHAKTRVWIGLDLTHYDDQGRTGEQLEAPYSP